MDWAVVQAWNELGTERNGWGLCFHAAVIHTIEPAPFQHATQSGWVGLASVELIPELASASSAKLEEQVSCGSLCNFVRSHVAPGGEVAPWRLPPLPRQDTSTHHNSKT